MSTKVDFFPKSAKLSAKKRLPFRGMGVDSAEWESLFEVE